MFAEVKLAEESENQQQETSTNSSKSRHSNQFKLAKSCLNDFLKNVGVLKSQNNATLNRLIDENTSLLDESE